MVDEEGFSPIEMARVISEKVSGNNGISEEGQLTAGDVILSQPFVQASKHNPTSILKRQQSSASEVKFDIQNVSDSDEADDTENPFRNHGVNSQDDPGMFKSNGRMNRPSTSNFLEVRSELNSGRYSLMDSDEGSMNVDTHTNDEVMRKM
jgi:hypothetical protein